MCVCVRACVRACVRVCVCVCVCVVFCVCVLSSFFITSVKKSERSDRFTLVLPFFKCMILSVF